MFRKVFNPLLSILKEFDEINAKFAGPMDDDEMTKLLGKTE
ncbi:MAG: hypothetical protein U5J96_15650 [Ignavibacteriaceae bacterium]|nr:hypothetical protein [Ignavibacteriaceae bacterium]